MSHMPIRVVIRKSLQDNILSHIAGVPTKLDLTELAVLLNNLAI